MPPTLPDGFFALENTVGLLGKQLEFIEKWIQLHFLMRDHCPDCPGPSVDLVNSTLANMNEVLRATSQAVDRIVAKETIADAHAASVRAS